MVIRKTSKKDLSTKLSNNKKATVQEFNYNSKEYEKFEKAYEKKITQEKKLEKERIEMEKKEAKRKYDIIMNYMTKFANTLYEKELDEFWVFPDKPGFKKITSKKFNEMKKVFVQNPDKYKGTRLCFVKILPHHDDENESFMKRYGIWLRIKLTSFHIGEKGDITNKLHRDYSSLIMWETPDFAISKPTFKFIETMVQLTMGKKHVFPSLLGVPLTQVMGILKKYKVDISDSFTPLAGI